MMIYLKCYVMNFSFQGVRVSQFDMCFQQDPCQNDGLCINTDSGPVCECRHIDYEGAFCEKGSLHLFRVFKKKKIIYTYF